MMIPKKIILSLLIVLPIFFLSGCGCKKDPAKQYGVDLEIWGLFDDSDVFSSVFEDYKKLNPNVESITYKKLSPDTYEKELLEALASDQGPDIFLIRNVWLDSFMDKLSPSPQDIVNEKSVQDEFVDVVADDFVSEGNVYALPLSVDSLNLFYNKDIFNKAGITYPPKTWDEFSGYVRKLTVIDSFGNIDQSGAAIGTAYNINRSVDILGLLLLQNNRRDSLYKGLSGRLSINDDPGREAFRFYTQFANSGNPAYSWNPRMHYSVDAFSEGNVAMMFNYSWQIPILRSKSPKLNFSVAEIPQRSDATTKIGYANYWGFGVSKKEPQRASSSGQAVSATNDQRIVEAWKLLRYLTMYSESSYAADSVKPKVLDPALDYAGKTGKPAARRDIIEKQKNIPETSIFSLGNLYAGSWRQFDATATESILAETIEQIVSGKSTLDSGTISAESKINNLENR